MMSTWSDWILHMGGNSHENPLGSFSWRNRKECYLSSSFALALFYRLFVFLFVKLFFILRFDWERKKKWNIFLAIRRSLRQQEYDNSIRHFRSLFLSKVPNNSQFLPSTHTPFQSQAVRQKLLLCWHRRNAFVHSGCALDRSLHWNGCPRFSHRPRSKYY